MIKAGRDGRSNFQLGTNENLFDYTYVGNVAHAHIIGAAKLLELVRKYESSPPADLSEAGLDGEDAPLELDGEPIIITNQSPIYFWDFARAIWHRYAALSPTPPPPVAPLSAVWQIPEGVAYSLGVLIGNVYSLFGLGVPRLSPSVVKVSCMPRYYRTNKSRTVLGYVPVWSLDEGLDRSIQWFCQREREEARKKGQ